MRTIVYGIRNFLGLFLGLTQEIHRLNRIIKHYESNSVFVDNNGTPETQRSVNRNDIIKLKNKVLLLEGRINASTHNKGTA